MLLSRYERMIARRYLLPGRNEAFIALVAGFSLVAVMLGVAALIVVMSVMNGFRAELFDKITGLNGHAVVQGYGGQLRDWRQIAERARALPGVTSATPLIEQPLFASFNGRVEFAQVRGMRVEDIRSNATLRNKEVVGSLNRIVPGKEQIAIGSRLAESLGATLGSKITIINPAGNATPMGTMYRSVSYTVTAIFEVGVYDFDKIFVIMPIEDAQTLLLLGDAVSMVEIDTNDPDHVERIVAPLADSIGRSGQMRDWREMNRELFEALSVDRIVSFTILSIILIVASFNIVSSLIMLVRSKTRDIAVLRTMGAGRFAVLRIFLMCGASVGVVGTLSGTLLGVVFCLNIERLRQALQRLTGTQLFNPEVYYLEHLPAKLEWGEVTEIIVMALLLSLLATIYPSWRAARTDPVEALRHE
jgi:lipoprotein-releasing system permease protein